ncbi:MAG: amino acid permease [Chitinivibrionales bacterium]|nr:amino acid permease [Chitinivibrionales bacterium]MBD3356806.1 amino acid permease [Chitinivibrionales bacterium]
MIKQVGFWGIFSISAGAMISSGLFVLPGLAFAKAGPVVFLSYFIAGAVALSTVFSLSELVTAMPKAGGDYFYVSRTFGKMFGTVSGLLSWFALSLKSAFAIIGLAELAWLAFGTALAPIAVILTVFFTVLNLLGVREATRIQNVLVAALFAILGLFALVGIQEIRLARYEPFLAQGYNALLSTAGFVFVSFGGVLTTASIAGEVREPARNIPLGLICSTVAVTILYSLVTFVVVGLVPAQELTTSLAPVAEAARYAGGPALHIAIVIASLFAFITTANGGILTASRYPIALANDGMMPRMLARESIKRRTPYPAIIATGLLIAVSVLLNLEVLVKAASTVILLTNIFAHLSVIVMRESRVANYLPSFRAPLYPWLQIGGTIIFSLLIIDMGIRPVLLSLLFVSVGTILYFLRRGRRGMAAPALVHLVERITNRKLGTRDLAEELRTIILDRDRIVKDEFDEVVETSVVLDIEEHMDLDPFLHMLADRIHTASPAIGANELVQLLREREEESSTALSGFVAIPHIVLEGNGRFMVLLIRARNGVRFSHEHTSVKAIFVLLGTRDKRNLHLRALAAIAQVVQNEEFELRWFSAKNEADLRDLVLLSSRKR